MTTAILVRCPSTGDELERTTPRRRLWAAHRGNVRRDEEKGNTMKIHYGEGYGDHIIVGEPKAVRVKTQHLRSPDHRVFVAIQGTDMSGNGARHLDVYGASHDDIIAWLDTVREAVDADRARLTAEGLRAEGVA